MGDVPYVACVWALVATLASPIFMRRALERLRRGENVAEDAVAPRAEGVAHLRAGTRRSGRAERRRGARRMRKRARNGERARANGAQSVAIVVGDEVRRRSTCTVVFALVESFAASRASRAAALYLECALSQSRDCRTHP